LLPASAALAVIVLLAALGRAGETRLPTVDEVKELQKRYRAEREALVKSGGDKRFLPDLLEHAEAIAKRADAALDAGRLLQASEAFRQARWQLPYQGPHFPDHVAHVFGNLRVRHGNEILAVAFSPDGKWLATGSRDRTVKIWDMANGHEAASYTGHQRYVRAVAFSPDSKWVASAGGDRDIRLWDPQSGKDVRTLKGTGNYITAMVISPDGKYVFAAGDDRTLQIYDTATGTIKRTLDFKFGGIRGLAFSPDGTRLAAGAENGQVRLWVYPDVVTLEAPEYWSQQDDEGSSNFVTFSPDSKLLIRCGPDALKFYDVQVPGGARVTDPHLVLRPPDDPKNKSKLHHFTCAAVSKDGKTLFTGCTDGLIRLNDMDGLEPAGVYRGHHSEITGLAFNRQGTQLASASSDYTVRLWNFDIVLQSREFAGHTEPIWAADFSPDGNRIISAGADRTARAWDVATGTELRKYGQHSEGLTAARFSPDGKSVLLGGGDKLLRIYDADTAKLLKTFEGHTGTVTAATFNHDGTRIVSGGADKTVIIWSVETAKPVATVNVGSIVMAVAFSPDGKQVVAGMVDQYVRIFDADKGQPGPAWKAHSAAVGGLAFDAKGEFLATCGFDSLVKIWKAAEPGTLVANLPGHGGPVSAVAFRPDGQYLVSAGNDHLVKLWKRDGASFKEAQVFRGHKDWVTTLAFSRNGYFVLSAGADHAIKVWEVASRELPLTAEHTGAVECVAVSPDGRLMASGGTDKTIKLWDLKSGLEILTIRATGDTVVALAFSPDSKTLYSSGADRNIRRWNAANGSELKPLENQHNITGFINPVPQLALRPDGKRLVAWIPFDERGSRVATFDTATGDEIMVINDRGKDVQAVAWTREIKMVAFGAKDGNVRVYATAQEKADKKPSDYQVFPKDIAVTSLALAPDGGYLVVGGERGTVAVVDPASGTVGKWLEVHKARVTAIAVSPDGKRFITASLDNVVKLLDAGGKELRRWAMPPLVQERGGFVTRLTFTPDGRHVITANANTTLFMLELP
jgi:WD40 repeat protein